MKLKDTFLAFLVICGLLFSTCDFLNGDDNNNNNGNETPSGGVEPLIKTQWNQHNPYNNLYPGNDTPADCKVIAIAQIMKYHKYPARGKGQSEPFTLGGVAYPPINLDVA
jgi:hypothetical protein